MNEIVDILGGRRLRAAFTLAVAVMAASCGRPDDSRPGAANAPAIGTESVPQSVPMGGAKSVTKFFVTRVSVGKGGDLGGLGGADAHCQALAKADFPGTYHGLATVVVLPWNEQYADEHVEFTVPEPGHLRITLDRLHPAVDETDLDLA